jgi:hypothetical protein
MHSQCRLRRGSSTIRRWWCRNRARPNPALSARHRLPLDRPPRLARAAARRPDAAMSRHRRGSHRPPACRPGWCAARRREPSIGNTQAVSVVARMHDHREADVADRLRHGVAPMRTQRDRRPIEPIDAAMVLLVQPIRIARAQAHAMRVVKVDRRRGRNLRRLPCRRPAARSVAPPSSDSCTPPPDMAK